MIALVFIDVAIAARSGLELAGAPRRVYVVATMGALYLNVTVGVVQAFPKVSVLHGLAPQQTEAPFVVTQAAVLALFVGLTWWLCGASVVNPSTRRSPRTSTGASGCHERPRAPAAVRAPAGRDRHGRRRVR
jgi:hypothetical protein